MNRVYELAIASAERKLLDALEILKSLSTDPASKTYLADSEIEGLAQAAIQAETALDTIGEIFN